MAKSIELIPCVFARIVQITLQLFCHKTSRIALFLYRVSALNCGHKENKVCSHGWYCFRRLWTDT